MVDIKKVIRDFVSFDIQNNYYQKEMKEDIVRMFKKILFEDEVTIRKFLQDFFKKTEELANEYSLIASDDEAESNETEEDENDEVETSDEENEEENEPEEGTEEDQNDEVETSDEENEEEKETVVAPESKQLDIHKTIFEKYTEEASDYLE